MSELSYSFAALILRYYFCGIILYILFRLGLQSIRDYKELLIMGDRGTDTYTCAAKSDGQGELHGEKDAQLNEDTIGRRKGRGLCLVCADILRCPAKATAPLVLIMVFTMSAFAFLSLREESFDVTALHFGAAVCAIMAFSYLLIRLRSRHFDTCLLIVSYMLFSLGIVMQYRMEPVYADKTLLWYIIGWLAFIPGTMLIHYDKLLEKLRYPIVGLSIAFLGILLLIGKEVGGAKNWLVIGGMSVQPSEFVKVSLVVVLAACLCRDLCRRKMLRLCAFCGVCVGLLALERDFGAALLIFGGFLVMFFVATGNQRAALLGAGIGCIGGIAMYFFADHVRARFNIWLDPWASYYTSGYQVAQGLMAIASGGLWGLGLMQGAPKATPAYHTDYIFAGICEEFGVIVGLALIAFYLLFILRGVCIALNAGTNYMLLLAFGCTSLIALQSFFIIGGVIKLIPLSGLTLPFVSYGGSSLVASMLILGILEGIAMQGGRRTEAGMEETAQ